MFLGNEFFSMYNMTTAFFKKPNVWKFGNHVAFRYIVLYTTWVSHHRILFASTHLLLLAMLSCFINVGDGFLSVMDTSTINCIYSKQLILLEQHEVGRKRKIWLLLLTFFYLLHNLISYKVYLLFKVSHNSSSHNMKRVTNKVDLPPDFQEWIRFFCSSNIILLNMKKVVEHKLHLQLTTNAAHCHVDYCEFICIFNASGV